MKLSTDSVSTTMTPSLLLSMPSEIRDNIWYQFLLSCYKDNIEERQIKKFPRQAITIVLSMKLLTITTLDNSYYSDCRKDDPLALLFLSSQQIAAEVRHVLLNQFRFVLNAPKEAKTICNILDRMNSEDQKKVSKIEFVSDIKPVIIGWTDLGTYVMAQLPGLRSVVLTVIIRSPSSERMSLVKMVMKLAVRFRTVNQLIVRLVGEDLSPLDKENTTADLTAVQEELTVKIAAGDWETYEHTSTYMRRPKRLSPA